ncbi:helicase associated domain-containing protein [Micrococcaceae bacterium Sec7.4]
MTPIMDRQLRRAPDAEWVLMYRLGLSRKRIAELVRAQPATVGYHLVIARRQDPGIEAAHLTANGTKSSPSPADLSHMDEIIAWVTEEGRFPRDRSDDKGERSMARWLSDRRREAAEGTLDPAHREEGHDWPRHKGCTSEREHTLGVWIHTQRHKHRRGELDPVKVTFLDAAAPGWQAGRTRGRPARR